MNFMLSQIYNIIMRKTKAQPQFRPKRTIKVPSSFKSRLNHRLDEEPEDNFPDFDKKAIIQTILSKEYEKKPVTQQRRREQYALERPKIFRSASKSIERTNFKIKISGGGFRKKGGSLLNLKTVKLSGQSKATAKEKRNLDMIKMKQRMEEQHIREYYSWCSKKEEEQKKYQSVEPQKERKPRINWKNLYKIILKEDDPEFQKSDFEWKEDEGSFKREGFGVNRNLSQYDLPSLDDPSGTIFMKNYHNSFGQCPYFEDKKYRWAVVKVIGYDSKSDRAIIIREGEKQQRKVSRLSLKFSSVAEEKYWKRIHSAKKIRKCVLEEEKYIRYIDGRDEEFTVEDIFKPEFSEERNLLIEKQCHTRYSKQFLVYQEMAFNYGYFKNLGIQKRQFQPFCEKNLCPKYVDYEQAKANIEKKHYLSLTNMEAGLKFLFGKLYPSETIIFSKPTTSSTIQEFFNQKCEQIREFMKKLKTKTREFVISDFVFRTINSFSSKKQEKRFYQLFNIIFKNLVMSNVYEQNTHDLIQYIDLFRHWTPKRSSPILTLSLKIDKKKKLIYSIPSSNEVFNKLTQIFEILLRETEKIPDLESDLFYQPQKCIKVQDKIDVSRTVREVVTDSYLKIEDFILRMKKNLKYLEILPFKKKKFELQTIAKYEEKLDEVVSDEKDVMHSSLEKSGLFRISLEPFKKVLSDKIAENKKKILKTIENQTCEEVGSLKNDFTKIKEKLKERPENQEEYVELSKYLRVFCERFLIEAKKHYELCGLFYDLMERYSYEYEVSEYEKFVESIAQHFELEKVMEKKRSQLMQIQKMLLQKINEDREKILKGIDEAKQQIQQIKALSNFDDYRDNFIKTSKLYYELHGFEELLSNVNYRQNLLKQELSIFPWLNKLIKMINPYFSMWNNSHSFLLDNQEWSQKSIIELNYEEVKQKIFNRYLKEFKQLIKHFDEDRNIVASGICQTVMKMVVQMEQKLWIIESFTKEGLLKKPNMMKDILSRIYGSDFPENFKNVNLHDLLNRDVTDNKDFIEETANTAQKIWNLEKKINSIVSDVKELYMQVSEKHKVQYIAEELLGSLGNTIKEQIQMMDIVKSEDQAKFIEKRIESVYSKIKIIEETIQSITKFEPSFFKLSRIFRINEIIDELPAEKTKMIEVFRIWNGIINHFERDLQVWEAIDSESYRNRIENQIKIMEGIHQALKIFFNQKRLVFPRLFFISDDELIEVVANEKYKIPPHRFETLFHGAKQPVSNETGIIGLEGHNGQKLVFLKPVNQTIIVWDRLKRMHYEMQRAMKREMEQAESSKFLSCIFLQQLCNFSKDVEEGIKKNEFKKVKKQYINKLQTLERIYELEEICKISICIIFNNIISELQSKNIESTSSFEWVKYLRVYRNANKQFYVKTLAFMLNVKAEFVGNNLDNIVYIMGSHKSSIHALLTLQKINVGCIVKHQSQMLIKSLSAFTMSHYVQKLLPTDIPTLKQYLYGYYSECFCGVLRCNRTIEKEMMSVLSQTAYEIQRIINSSEYFTQSFGFPLKLYPNSEYCVYLSIPENNQTLFHSNEIFKVTYRSIGIIPVAWSVRFKIYTQTLSISQYVVEKALKCAEELMLDNCVSLQINMNFIFNKILSHCIEKKISSNLQFKTVFFETIITELPPEKGQIIEKYYENTNLKQEKIFCQLLKTKKKIIVIGERQSGKSTLIEECIKKLQFNYQKKLIFYEENDSLQNPPEWIVFDGEYNESIVEQDFISCPNIVYEFSSIKNLTPKVIAQLPIFYKRNTLNWEKFLQKEITKLKQYTVLQQEVKKQIQIFFKQIAVELSYQNQINYISSFVKAVIAFVYKNLIPLTEISHAKEIILMINYWISVPFTPTNLLHQRFYDSILNEQKKIDEYFYDIEKSAWIQWTVIELQFFQKRHENYHQIYLPIKETTSILYFSSILSEFTNLLLMQEERGSGLSTILRKVGKKFRSSKWLVQEMYLSYFPSNLIEKMILKQYTTKRPDGRYCPYRNSQMLIIIDDLNIKDDNIEKFYIKSLIGNKEEIRSHRQFAKTRFLTTISNNFPLKNIQSILKNMMMMKMKKVSENSMESIFDYILNWHFENTDNPFSKQVRNMKEILVDISIKFYQQISTKAGNNFINQYYRSNFKIIANIYDFLTMSHPKTVKKSSQIIQAWVYEANMVCESSLKLKNWISETLKNHDNQEVQEAFCDLTLARVSNDFYQKYDIEDLRRKIKRNFSQISDNLLFHDEFIIQLAKDTRLFLRSKSNMMKIGLPKGGRKTSIKYAGYLSVKKFPTFIHEYSLVYWKKEMMNFFAQLNQSKSEEIQTLVFEVFSNSSPQYLEFVSQLIHTQEPKSLIYEVELNFLDKLSIYSHHSAKYNSFKEKCKQKLNCVICLRNQEAEKVVEKCPSFLKYCKIIQLDEEVVKESLVNIAKVGFQHFYGYYEKMVQIHQILTQNDRSSLINWSLEAYSIYQQAKQKFLKHKEHLLTLQKKKQITLEQKKELERQLQSLLPKLAAMISKNELILDDMNKFRKLCSQKQQAYENHDIFVCKQKRQNTTALQEDYDFQLSKLQPLLDASKESLEKLTKIDIDQLRKFPQPPEPAVKVVEALCFVFNEDHLVKERVLQNGQKILDYWDYAKKFILNDKIFKRIDQFKPEYIKSLKKSKMLQLKKITEQKQFQVERVFKASSAAGNLSVWMRAVISTFEVMEVIDPKRQALNEALEDLASAQEKLRELKEDMDAAMNELMRKKSHYEEEMNKQKELQNKIQWLRKKIQRSERFLKLLSETESEWATIIDKEIPEKLQKIKIQSILASLYSIYLLHYSLEERESILLKIEKIVPEIKKFSLQRNNYSMNYTKYFLEKNYPFNKHYADNVIIMLKKLQQNKNLLIFDQTQTMHEFIEGETINCLQYTEEELKGILKNDDGINDIENDQSRTGTRLSQKSQQKKKKIFVLLNLEHYENIIHQFSTDLNIKFPKSQIIIVVNTLIPQQKLSFDIYNELNQQTINAFIEKNVCPISYQNSHLNSLSSVINHEDNLKLLEEELIWRFLQSNNILLEDETIERWMECHQQLKEKRTIVLKIKDNNPIEIQTIKKLSEPSIWEKKITFKKYLRMIESNLEERAHEAMYTLRQELTHFIQMQKKYHLNIVEKTQKLGNIFLYYKNQFQQPLYAQSLAYLPFYIQAQKTVIFMKNTKVQAYEIVNKIHQQFKEFVEKQLEISQEFDPEQYQFTVFLLILEENHMFLNQVWKNHEYQGSESETEQIQTKINLKLNNFTKEMLKYCKEFVKDFLKQKIKFRQFIGKIEKKIKNNEKKYITKIEQGQGGQNSVEIDHEKKLFVSLKTDGNVEEIRKVWENYYTSE